MTTRDIDAAFELRFATRENRITEAELAADYALTRDSLAEAMQTVVRGWVCEAVNQMVGFSMGDSRTGEVTVVAVRPEFEGQGIARNVLAKVCEWLFVDGRDELWLYSNPDPDTRAFGFYRRLGWRSTGRMHDNDEIMTLHRSDWLR